MSRWLKQNVNEKVIYLREWTKTEKGIAYRKRRAEAAKEWRKNNKERFHATQKRNYQKMRLECLTHYSNPPKCACCGEDNIVFLSIDHVNGDGADQRRKLKKELGYFPGGNNLPYWLKKNNYPEGYQVLCYNCNFAKRQNKECPHKTKVQNILTN